MDSMRVVIHFVIVQLARQIRGVPKKYPIKVLPPDCSDEIERIVKTNGISLNVVEQGQGPLVLLCHGFPESSYSWRHQIDALAAAGFHAVAPDMRGPTHPTSLMPQTGDAQFYQLYFQAPGVAEAEFEKDLRLTLRANLFGGSGEGITAIRAMNAASGKTPGVGMVPRGGGMLPSGVQVPLPSWLSEAYLEVYAGEFARSGFRGPLNYYRNVDRNWELMAALDGIKVAVPALYIAGDHDLVVAFPGAAEHIANMKQHVPLLRDIQMLAGCGHWTQQERPAEVSAAIIEFLRGLPN
jgi:pimeloyl-ACP methyl ester carboxylesterase